MQRDRDDQQQEDSGVGDRAEDDAIEQRRNGQHQQKRENDAKRHRQIVGDGQSSGADRQRRQREIKAERARQGPPAAQPSQGGRLDQGRERREPEHQAGRAGQTLLVERRQGQSRERRDVAEGHKDHARHGKDQHEADRHQNVDGAVGDPVDGENRRDVERHRPVIARSEATKQPRGRLMWPLGCFAALAMTWRPGIAPSKITARTARRRSPAGPARGSRSSVP